MSGHFFIVEDGCAVLYCKVQDRTEEVIDGWVINGAWGFKLVKGGHMSWHSPWGYDERVGVTVMWLYRAPFDDYNEAINWAQRRVDMHAPRRWACEQLDRIAFNWSIYTARLRRTIRAARLAWNGAPAKTLIDEDDLPF